MVGRVASRESGPSELVRSRPVWASLTSGALLGGAIVSLWLGHGWVSLLLGVASVGLATVATPRRPRVTDGRAVLAQFGLVGAGVLILFCTQVFLWSAETAGRPALWVILLAGLVTGITCGLGLWLTDLIQVRRLRAGDFRSWDLS